MITSMQRDIHIIMHMRDQAIEEGDRGQQNKSVHLSWHSDFRPDEVIPLNDVIALYDFTYTRYTHVFRCIQPSGRQILLQAETDSSLNSWISAINYAATFRSVGIRQRNDTSPGSIASRSMEGQLPRIPDHPRETLAKASVATSISAISTMASSDSGRTLNEAEPRQALDSPIRDTSKHDLLFGRSTQSDLAGAFQTVDARSWHATRGDIVRVSF